MKRYIRSDIEYDSEGNELTPEQSAFFKDSKIRDSQGRLLVCYHGSRNQFDTFKINYNTYGTDKVSGVYFAPCKLPTQYYSQGKYTYKCYLNCKNPKIVHRPEEQDGDMTGYDGLIALSTNPWERKIYNYETDAVEVDHIDANGIIEIIAFNPNQVKSITNKYPTNNSNINASKFLKENTMKRYIKSAIGNPLEEDEDTQHLLAIDQYATPEMLEQLSYSSDWFLRSDVAENPNTPKEVLARLAEDEEINVRESVAFNPNTPNDVLLKMIEDNKMENPEVLSLISRKHHDEEVLLALIDDCGWSTPLMAVAENPKTPVSVLKKLAYSNAYDWYGGVRHEALDNLRRRGLI